MARRRRGVHGSRWRITRTGNSYAAPHLSGIAAPIKSKHPDLRPVQLKTVLWATAATSALRMIGPESSARRL